MNATSLEVAIQKFVSWPLGIGLEFDSATTLPLMKQLQILQTKPRDLIGFIQLANSIRYHCIPDPNSFMVRNNFVCMVQTKTLGTGERCLKNFIISCILSHFQDYILYKLTHLKF